jgi:hypothetical protein
VRRLDGDREVELLGPSATGFITHKAAGAAFVTSGNRLDVSSVDFTVQPPDAKAATLTANSGRFQGDHIVLLKGQSVAFEFQLAPVELQHALDIAVRGFVSPNAGQSGYAPVTLAINGVTCAPDPSEDFTASGDGVAPGMTVSRVAPAALQPHKNTLTLTISQATTTSFCLSTLAVRQNPVPYAGRTLAAQFGPAVPRCTPGLTLTANDGAPAGGYAEFSPGGHCVATFPLARTNAANDELVVGITASALSPHGNVHEPLLVDVVLNGTALASELPVGRAGDPQYAELRAPAPILTHQTNTLELRVSANEKATFQLYSLKLTATEYYEELDYVDFRVNPARVSGVTISVPDGTRFVNDHIVLNRGTSLKVAFSHAAGLPLFVKLTRPDPKDWATVQPTLSVNGSRFFSGYWMPRSAYTDGLFAVPAALVRDGANELTLSVAEFSANFLLSRIELLALFDGPNYVAALMTAAGTYTAFHDITQVPLAFLLAYPSSVLSLLDRVVEMDDSFSLGNAIAALEQLTGLWSWFAEQVRWPLASGSDLHLADTTINHGSQNATDLQRVMAYITTRTAQELDRLQAIEHGTAPTLDYTRGANVATAIKSRLAQIGAVQPSGSSYTFTDAAIGRAYTFDTATLARGKRTTYAALERCEIIESTLEEVDQSLRRLAAESMSPSLLPATALAVALVAAGVFSLASNYLLSQSLPSAESPKAYKMNWHGWVNDWSQHVSYDWQTIPGVGWLKPGNVWNVCDPTGSRSDKPLGDESPGAVGGYFNYVWLPGDTYPVRLSWKDPTVSPPGETYHSQLAGGKELGCAGEIQFADGYFRYINANSGHYYKNEPDWNACASQVLDTIHAMGYDVSRVDRRNYYRGPGLEFLKPELR